MKWQLHNTTIHGTTNHPELENLWERSFSSLPKTTSPAHIHIQLDIVPDIPVRPDSEPNFGKGESLEYYLDRNTAVAHFPSYGQLRLDLAEGITQGQIIQAALTTYGVLEDLVAVSVSPHLRRRGMYLVHAFASAYNGQAVMIVGGIGAGKTTTGMSLLNAGWRLLSNDSPILAAEGMVRQYPGVLAAFPHTFAQFPTTAHLANLAPTMAGRKKISVQAEDVWPDVWMKQAPLKALIFPKIENRAKHALEPIPATEALRRILPHAMEQWDAAIMPAHLSLLSDIVQRAPAYVLRLSPNIHTIPAAIQSIL